MVRFGAGVVGEAELHLVGRRPYSSSSDGKSVLRAARCASGRAHDRHLTERVLDLTGRFDW